MLGHHVSQGSSLLSGTCCPLPGSNPRQRKAACYLHGLVGRLIILLSSEESPEPVQGVTSVTGGRRGRQARCFSLASQHGEFLQGPLLTDLGASHRQRLTIQLAKFTALGHSGRITTTDYVWQTSGSGFGKQGLFYLVMKSIL